MAWRHAKHAEIPQQKLGNLPGSIGTMRQTYSEHAAVCIKFYDLVLNRVAIDQFVAEHFDVIPGARFLFVGSMFGIAECLLRRGVRLTVVDYSDAMVAIAQARFPQARVAQADLRCLPFTHAFDAVVAAGRVFAHMISDDDLRSALLSCRAALKPYGKLFVDNYEVEKIERTAYLNGEIHVEDSTANIVRRSSITTLCDSPCVVQWDATYSGFLGNAAFAFRDTMLHRPWSRQEISSLLSQAGFAVLRQGDNFDDTSFFTLARSM
ncbi:class I SAM-dependent methyltransferase [Oxalobacteraceae bacterium OM1]|nr:class I SAM-dependent methyltransferase [Oxalobacteraceae bacterium OM1]